MWAGVIGLVKVALTLLGVVAIGAECSRPISRLEVRQEQHTEISYVPFPESILVLDAPESLYLILLHPKFKLFGVPE